MEHLLNGGGFGFFQLSDNALHKYAHTMAIRQRAARKNKRSVMSLNPEEKPHEHTCIYHQLAGFIWTIQNSLSVLRAERPVSTRIKYILQQGANCIERLRSPQSAVFLLLAIQIDFLREIQSKSGTKSKTQDLTRLQKQNQPVGLLTLLSNMV